MGFYCVGLVPVVSVCDFIVPEASLNFIGLDLCLGLLHYNKCQLIAFGVIDERSCV